MIDNSSVERHVDDRSTHRPAYLASARALSACARELARLGSEVADGVAALASADVTHAAVVRQSPDRCIVQLGPVALTVAWIKSSHDSVAAGELLAIIWQGSVAPRQRHEPERPSRGRAPLPPTAIWEQVLAPVGDSEESWAWQPRESDLGPYSSTELAALCVERLRRAYLDTPESAN